MNKLDLLIIISSLAFTLSCISTIIGLVALVKVLAAEKSTHTMTYMPVDPSIEEENEKVMKNWATKESVIAKDQELFQEDLESEMPDFFPDEDERRITSY